MRYVALAAAGIVVLGACSSLLTPAGNAKARWAALENTRAAKAAGKDAEKICKNMNVIIP